VEFDIKRPVDHAVVIYRQGDEGEWQQADASLSSKGTRVKIDAQLLEGTTSYFFNVLTDGLTISSELQTPGPARGPNPELTGFNWDRVPLNIHFAKRGSDLTDEEIDFLASHSGLIALEKGHGASVHGSTEKGIADTARRIKQRNPEVKVLFYLNAFINWGGYESFETYRPEWTLRIPRVRW